MLDEEIVIAEEFSALAEFRSKIYGFLSSMYIQIPDHDYVKKLLDEEVFSFLLALPPDIGLPQEMEEGLEDMKRFIRASKGQAIEEVSQNLSAERTRLFRGIKPGYSPPPPYESVYVDEGEALMGKAAVEVQRKYTEAGVGVPDECKEPPDYIGFELDFMRFLTEKEAESWRKEERDDALGYLNMERDFLEEHITKWVPEFCDGVIARVELDFYRGIAQMSKGFVTDDREKIEGFIDILRK